MRIPSRRRLKKELNRKLIYHPLIRMLLFKVWFRVAFFILIGLGIFLSLFLPKIWRTTPKGFMPVVRVSGLDLLQARSLKRTAVQSMLQGKHEAAHYSWRTAVANNPADPELSRGMLATLLQMERLEPGDIRLGVRFGVWLLKLTSTNQTDLDLVARVLHRSQQHAVAGILLKPHLQNLSPPTRAIYLKALFGQEQYQEFDLLWKASIDKLPEDPELVMYRAAYNAGWGTPEEAVAGRALLKERMEDPNYRVLAHRLQLVYCRFSANLELFEPSFRKLEEWKEDKMLDHIRYWALLTLNGRREEARTLAQSYPGAPASDQEATQLAEIFVLLGLRQYAIEFLTRFAEQFPEGDDTWVLYANLLVEEKKWEQIRKITPRMRQISPLRDELTGFSHYIEGRAELGQNRVEIAKRKFGEAVAAGFRNPSLAFSVASRLIDLGYFEPARDLLLAAQSALAGKITYWDKLFEAAYKLKDAELVMKATAGAYALEPRNATIVNRYAAALLLTRKQPEVAVKLTLQLSEEHPNSLAAVVNHGLALLMNGRIDEAGGYLNRVDPAFLAPPELAAFQLAWFELLVGKGELVQARDFAKKVDLTQLFPNQVEWLQAKMRDIDKTLSPKES